MHMNLLDIRTLASGTSRQKEAFQALTDTQVFEHLKEYSPVLAGTIPLDVDIPESDLDVICSSDNLEKFAMEVEKHFGNEEAFSVHHTVKRDQPTVIARFKAKGFQFEIFAQTASVFTQPAVVHMLIEARLLSFAPPEAKAKIRQLKHSGLKTEPAFAETFALEGDPYEELLRIARLPDHEILMIAHNYRWMH